MLGTAGAAPSTAGARVRPVVRPVVRVGVPVAVLTVLVHQLGAGPFVRAVDRITPGAVLVAALVTAVTTACMAHRWTWVARRLGLRIGLPRAVAAYYRSQLLDQVLPGGVLGDVERAAHHGRDQAALGRAARAVVWERVLGQVGLVFLALLVVAGLPSTLRERMVALLTSPTALAVVVTAVGAGVVAVASARRGRGRAVRAPATLVTDLRRFGGMPWTPLLLSLGAAAGHLVVLLVAVRTAGVDVPLPQAVPLLAVVLVASSLPTNLAGWGPREGAAAWVFGATGLTAADGVTVAVLYGMLSLAATAPGVLVLALDALPRRVEVPAT
jgi:glycosyltransferase 2 family protein